MDLSRMVNKFVLAGAFLVCITLGFGLALVLKERLGGSAAEDPCFGQGQLVSKWQHEVTQQDIDSVAASRPDLSDVKPGMVEYRQCRWGPGYTVTIDEKGHVFNYTQPTLAEMEAYYKEHPDESPPNQMATVQAKSKQEMSVTPALPDPTVMGKNILAGCDPSWDTHDFASVGLRLCYPHDWQVIGDKGEVSIGNGVTTMYFTAKSQAEWTPDCPDPAIIKTSGGDAKLCEAQPNLVEQGQGHSLILPSRHQVRHFISEPTLDNKWLALRIALSAEDLP